MVAVDEADRVVLVHQYRHPVGQRLWEIPAGLLDVPGEDPAAAAARELAEEAHVQAADWRVLADPFSSPGMTTEALPHLPGPRPCPSRRVPGTPGTTRRPICR